MDAKEAKSLKSFKAKIKTRRTNKYPCRFCKHYLGQIGFVCKIYLLIFVRFTLYFFLGVNTNKRFIALLHFVQFKRVYAVAIIVLFCLSVLNSKKHLKWLRKEKGARGGVFLHK